MRPSALHLPSPSPPSPVPAVAPAPSPVNPPLLAPAAPVAKSDDLVITCRMTAPWKGVPHRRMTDRLRQNPKDAIVEAIGTPTVPVLMGDSASRRVSRISRKCFITPGRSNWNWIPCRVNPWNWPMLHWAKCIVSN